MGRKRGVCRMCNLAQPVNKAEFSRASSPRCVSCGGLLDEKGKWIGKPKLAARPSYVNIRYGGPPSEFEIQAFLYSALLGLGFNVRGEVKADGNVCVFDIVIFDWSNIARLIIEVKKHTDCRAVHQDQLKKYKNYGVPVILVDALRSAKDVIKEINQGQRIGRYLLSTLHLAAKEESVELCETAE